MTLVVPNPSEALLLTNMLSVESLLLKLYSNDYTPVFGTVVGDLTELSVTGYSAKTLSPGSWTITASSPSGPATALYAQQTWGITAACTSYGYYLVGATSGALYWLERFTDGPYVIDSSGGQIKVTPQFQGASFSGN
jgi:hypothetical protein